MGDIDLAHARSPYYGEEAGQSCAGCHGETAEGGGEGGLRVPPLAPLLATGGPYRTPEQLCAAVRDGKGVDGRTLSGLMPRRPLSDRECADLQSFLAGLSEQVFRPGDDQIRVAIRIDPRSATQQRWRETIIGHLTRADEGSGIHGRSIVVTDGATLDGRGTTMALDLTDDERGIDAPAVITRDDPEPEPPRRSIESTLSQEITALAVGHPARVMVIPGVKPGDPVWQAVESVGTPIVEDKDCAATHQPLVIVLDEAAALQRTGLCPPDADTYVSLRRVRSADVERLRSAGRWSGATGVFAPVPLGMAMQSIPDRLASIILLTLREMGREPRRMDVLRAFGYSWASIARAGDTMFAGTSLIMMAPTRRDGPEASAAHDDAGPRWFAAP